MNPELSQSNDDPVLTTSRAAHILGVAVSTAQLWIENGALESWKTPGGHRRVRLSAVLRLLEAQKRGVAALRSPHAFIPTDVEFLPRAAPTYPVPVDEAKRLLAVNATGIIDTPPEVSFDRLTWLATLVSDTPMALITLLTSRRQWFKSSIGVDITETPREWAFCSHAILEPEALIVEDATADSRFSKNPLVTGEPFIKFYAGFPLIGNGGHKLGTLCVLDQEPRKLRDKEIKALKELTEIASETLRNVNR